MSPPGTHDDPQLDDDPLLRGLLAGRYRIEARLARGGMARVYRARDVRLERPVAVKVLASPYAEDAAFVRRFLEEARTAASFSHPNLAHVYDSGSDGEARFIVFELLDRHRSLRDELRRRGPVPPDEAARIGGALLAGLAPLHARGLLHCDAKPGNVMIGPAGTKLIDFGIARPQRGDRGGATSIGSLHAMSPEQLRGEELTPASDLFAVGVVLYEALTGRVPYPGETPDEVAAAHERGVVAPPSSHADDVGPRLDAAVLQALATEPSERFASAEAMSTALTAALTADRRGAADEETTTVLAAVRPVAGPRPPSRRARRSGGPGGALVGLGLVVAGGALVAAVGFGLADAPGNGGPASSPTPDVTPTLAPGTVRVPNTISMSEAEAEAAARAAGLNWRIEWLIDRGQTPGIYDQEPAPGTVVPAGARFVMYAYRSE